MGCLLVPSRRGRGRWCEPAPSPAFQGGLRPGWVQPARALGGAFLRVPGGAHLVPESTTRVAIRGLLARQWRGVPRVRADLVGRCGGCGEAGTAWYSRVRDPPAALALGEAGFSMVPMVPVRGVRPPLGRATVGRDERVAGRCGPPRDEAVGSSGIPRSLTATSPREFCALVGGGRAASHGRLRVVDAGAPGPGSGAACLEGSESRGPRALAGGRGRLTWGSGPPIYRAVVGLRTGLWVGCFDGVGVRAARACFGGLWCVGEGGGLGLGGLWGACTCLGGSGSLGC